MTERDQPLIVVGVDGSATGRRALEWALREAQARTCAVQAVNVWTYDVMSNFTDTTIVELHQRSLDLLRREIDLVTRGMADVPRVIRDSIQGSPAKVLPEAARGAAMLVVGRHQGGLARQLLLGSVSAMCVRHATCPVVVIPIDLPPNVNHSTEESS